MHHNQQFIDDAYEQLVEALNNLVLYHGVSMHNPFLKSAKEYGNNLKECYSMTGYYHSNDCEEDSYQLHNSLFDLLSCYDHLSCDNKYFVLCEDARDRLTNSGDHHEVVN